MSTMVLFGITLVVLLQVSHVMTANVNRTRLQEDLSHLRVTDVAGAGTEAEDPEQDHWIMIFLYDLYMAVDYQAS